MNDPMPKPRSFADLDPGDNMRRMPLEEMREREWGSRRGERSPVPSHDIGVSVARASIALTRLQESIHHSTGTVYEAGQTLESIALQLGQSAGIAFAHGVQKPVARETPDERIARQQAEKQANCRVKPQKYLGGKR